MKLASLPGRSATETTCSRTRLDRAHVSRSALPVPFNSSTHNAPAAPRSQAAKPPRLSSAGARRRSGVHSGRAQRFCRQHNDQWDRGQGQRMQQIPDATANGALAQGRGHARPQRHSQGVQYQAPGLPPPPDDAPANKATAASQLPPPRPSPRGCFFRRHRAADCATGRALDGPQGHGRRGSAPGRGPPSPRPRTVQAQLPGRGCAAPRLSVKASRM